MTHRLFGPRWLGSVFATALFLPGVGYAQHAPPVVVEENPGCANCPQSSRDGWVLHRGKNWDVGVAAGPVGPGYWHSGYPYGPRVAPGWGYPGLGGGPYIGYPGYYGYSGRLGDFWTNGLSLHGPPVPVYGPIPGVFGNNDLVNRWETHPAGLPLGWIGIYAASPRPRHLTVGVQPHAESVPIAPNAVVAAPAPAPAPDPAQATAGSLILSVRVPQPAAEVFVDGLKTSQTGTDRVFESPPLEGGKQFKYEVTAKWIEGGAVREVKKAVVGTPGEVVRVDFTTGN